MKYLGIDVGKAGALAVLDEGSVFTSPMPLIGNQYDIDSLREIILSFGPDIHIGIEDVHAIQGGNIGSSSMFSFGEGKGILQGLLVGLRLPYVLVQPKAWQKVAWEGVTKVTKPTKNPKKEVVDTKATSLLAAKRLFTNVAAVNPPLAYYADTPANRACGRAGQLLPKQPAPHDGIIDALLIAYYLKTTR